MTDHVRKLSLGTAQFGFNYGVSNANDQKIKASEVRNILNFSSQIGISSLDTAPSYGDSEKVLGDIGVSNFDVVSKLPSMLDKEINFDKSIPKYLFNSLSSLKKESLYGFLVHDAKDLLSKKGEIVYKSLMHLKNDGLVNKIGVSVYESDEIEVLTNYFDLDLIQAPFNIIDNRLIDSGAMSYINKSGIELHVRSVFLQGLLIMNSKNRPKKFDYWSELWTSWNEWLNDNHLSALEATIRYALSKPEITKVIVGVDSLNQLEQIISASNGNLPPFPKNLQINDIKLLNPSNWSLL